MSVIKYFHPVVWNILIGTVFARVASFMTIPFLALYLHRELDADPITIGIILGLAPLLATVGGFIGGYLTDRFGRKVIILSSVFMWGAVFIGFAFSNSLIIFGILSALNGLCRSFFEPATQAFMLDYTEQSKRRRLFSFRYTAINIAAVIGPLMGAWLSTMANPKIPFLVTALMYIMYGIVLVFVLNRVEKIKLATTPKRIGDVFQVVFKDKKLLYLLGGGILISIGYAQFDSTLPQHITLTVENGVKLYSTLLALNAVVILIFQLPLTMLSEKIPMLNTMVIGITFFIVGFILFNLADSWTTFIVAMIVFSIGEIFAFPMMSALIEEIAPNNQKATYLGAGQLKNIGGFIGPILGGWLLVHAQSILFYIMALIIFSSIPLYFKALSKKQMDA